MGFRPVCGVANTIATAILEAAYHTSQVDTALVEGFVYIDNLFLVAPDTADGRRAAKRLAAAILFHSRKVGAILNGWDYASWGLRIDDVTAEDAVVALANELDEQFEALLTAEAVDILGARYDLVAVARGLTETTKVKVDAATNLACNLQGRSRRQMAAIYGLLLYASKVLRLAPQLPRVYDAMSYFRRLSSLGQVAGWEGAAPPLRECEVAQLRLWLDLAASAPSTPLATPVPELSIFTDASAWGAGAVAFAPNGTAQTMSVPWTEADRLHINTGSSVSAEPAGVLKALCRFLPPSFSGTVDVAVDHQPLVYAAAAGLPRARVYAACLAEVAERWPQATIRFFFVAGEENPADPYSRGRVVKDVVAGGGGGSRACG
jgi:hypothetical protein